MNLLYLYNRFKPNYYQSLGDLALHIGLLSSTLFTMWYYKESYVGLVAIPIFSLLQIKSFIMFHDCGHNSFTPNKRLNYVIGSLLGITVLTPLSWTYDHTVHHLTSGNKENKLSHRENETIHHTFDQYKCMNYIQKTITKIWRSVYIYYILVPFVQFLIKYRFEVIYDKLVYNKYNQSLRLILLDNSINLIGNILLICALSNMNILHYYVLSTIEFYMIGMCLFHNQHTFNPPYITDNKSWSKQTSGLKGSSFIQIPRYLKFFTYGIEYHHIHHMISIIPGYNLHLAHEYLEQTEPEFKNIVKLSMKDCYNNLWLTLYDEESDRYISFREADEKIKNK